MSRVVYSSEAPMSDLQELSQDQGRWNDPYESLTSEDFREMEDWLDSICHDYE